MPDILSDIWNPAAFNPNSFEDQPGQPLPPNLKHEMEVSCGTDLSSVLIHENHAATHLNGPYADGNNIYYPPGKYQPFAPIGDELVSLMRSRSNSSANSAPPGSQTVPGQTNVVTMD